MAYFNNKRIMLACAYEAGGSGTTLKGYLDARGTAAGLFNGYNGTSVEGIIAYNDTENVTSTERMFYNCRNLISVGDLNLSNDTNATYMFNGCSSLVSVGIRDISNLQSLNNTFIDCSSLTTLPTWVATNLQILSYAFFGCSSLRQINITLPRALTGISYAFYNCSLLESVPFAYTQNLTDFQGVFYGCAALKVIPAYDVRNVRYFNTAFTGCTNLEEIHMTGMKVSFNISASTKFTESALVEILNNLATVSSATLTMGATNLAKLTQAEIDIATNKGWTLA